MRIIAFITDSKAILDISKSLDFPDFQKPPPINSPPVFWQTQIFTDLVFANWENYSQVEDSNNLTKPKAEKSTLPQVQTADELLKKTKS